MDKKSVLFLCTGNSCRSQLAEAIVNHDLVEQWEASSAGTQPAGYVHPLALKALEEIGIHHSGESKSVDSFREDIFDAVITVCDDANETCPIWLGKGSRVHIGFPDPAMVNGCESEKMAAFRQVRDDIRKQIPVYLLSHQTIDTIQE